MKVFARNLVATILMAVIIGICGFASLSSVADESSESVSKDTKMTTNYYKTEVTVNDDNSYSSTETIDVSFKSPRHGIYRYIPYMGNINKEESDGTTKKVPYYADIEIIDSNTKIHSVENSNGTKCITFGDEDIEVKGDNQYVFDYEIVPKTQDGYETIYYNIFPTGWRNTIPAGSEFIVHFPKDTPHNLVKLYYGSYGESKDASDIADVVWNGNTMTGFLKSKLSVGNGLTLYAPAQSGYFTKVNTMPKEMFIFIAACIIISAAAVILYIKYGRDEKIIESIQFAPPENLDSAAAGYVIDGFVDNEDIISLIIYLADKGYIKIKKEKKDEISLVKVKNLEKEIPDYIRTIFNGIFGENSNENIEVKLSSLKYNFTSKMDKCRGEIKSNFSNRLYTGTSNVFRSITLVLSIIPMQIFILQNNLVSYTLFEDFFVYSFFGIIYAVGILILAGTVDAWYSIKSYKKGFSVILGTTLSIIGIAVVYYEYISRVNSSLTFSWKISLYIMIVSSVILGVCAVFIKKRTQECTQLMGYLIGFKDFIEKAELDRIKLLAEENPQWFYSVLPYAYVFGLSNVWIKKFENIAVTKPDWYYGMDDNFSFYAFNTMLMKDLNKAEKICISVQSSGGSGGSSGSGGGGFSGGGFGGGGGGSW